MQCETKVDTKTGKQVVLELLRWLESSEVTIPSDPICILLQSVVLPKLLYDIT
jgi:hypothetical protein